MKVTLFVLNILLILIDIAIFIRLWAIYKKYAKGDELVVPTKKVMPYAIAMVVIGVLIAVINIGLAVL